ncbi:NAD-dependent succinate-semialdehyde dehydrogenase [Novosphingobium taihuense]|uniref:Succinate-semialdehyde dehydrogenase/glutarate-semialdehyde dehydrogenase n=1 Tax=Novosphingobium taihuense TaxID=260085 RepID=A0A7W7AC45_9SPHN|nr:NAD-dependent succinate-semialdehyde dehydrogenase [Novosphingobium taihuense]MBB4614197.1 succinate-semialdehyde dehydrogenase/glutarate-semialdehyde dehydrogenase [Novosphingobium taihuense]TWH87046.1 succinate-semialdehyde dehydrogenase/glutarate-semialdehyde dehydrogenase [Novosphingobium taihuense]
MELVLDRSDMRTAAQDLLRDAAYIDGAWVHGLRTIEVLNPADGSLVGKVPLFGAEETRLAVTAAHRAQGAWAGQTGKERGAILRRWAELMLEHREALAWLMTAEQGKPLAEASGEVAYAASFLEWFAEEARRVTGALLSPHASDRRLLVRKSPVGVVAAVTPWNFPLAMITRKAGPALAAGCTIVVKPSELTPLSALALARLSEEAGVPRGVFNVVMGDAPAIGDVLTGDKRVRKFTFTGSTAVGKLLAARCAGTVKRVSLELGGNAPFIVFDDADIDAAIEGALASKFRNAGQTCVCANRILVQSGVHDDFAVRLADRVRTFRVGPGLAGPTDQGPLIDSRALAKAQAHVDDAVSRGGRLLAGGTRLIEGALADGNFFAPTVIADVPRDALLCREETFAPVAGLIRFETEDEAIRIANDTDAGLAAYVYTQDLARSWRMPEALAYGMVGLNTGLISTEAAPFGGVKESGLGREGSSFGMDDYLDIKLTCLGL